MNKDTKMAHKSKSYSYKWTKCDRFISSVNKHGENLWDLPTDIQQRIDEHSHRCKHGSVQHYSC